MSLLGNQIPFSETNTMSYTPVVANVPLATGNFVNPMMPVGTAQIVSPATPYIPYQQQQIRLY
ncbi:MAG: hypothetical protein L6V95_06185 [Candidatus Melainabacteria bacterium]|nr:MAG: hypothetical protein L6V95_06185 [Candidatus Melainabacteria bacterium]